jgi:hypothetical protein
MLSGRLVTTKMAKLIQHKKNCLPRRQIFLGKRRTSCEPKSYPPWMKPISFSVWVAKFDVIFQNAVGTVFLVAKFQVPELGI